MTSPRHVAHEALLAVLSDDHNAEAGDTALQAIIARVTSADGEKGLQGLAFDAVIKLAELTERMALVERLDAVDLADVLFLD